MDRPERMRAVSQQLLSRTVLERTARLEHLDQDGSIESAISRIRGSVSVSLPDSITPTAPDGAAPRDKSLSPDQKAQLDTYQVSVVDDTPEDAQRIVNRLAQVFVEENSRSREVRAQDTSQFIESQLQASGTRLNALEARLRTMKESFMGRLPEQTNANLAMVSAMQRQLESNATTMRAEQDRLSMIERQIDALQQGADSAVARDQGHAGRDGAVRVQTLRRELADAQLNYTDKHPEIVRLKDELATAEKAAAAERARPAADRVGDSQAPRRSTASCRRTARSAKMRISELQRQQTAITGAGRAVPDAASKARRASSSRWSRCSASTTSSAAPTRICRARSSRRCSTRSCSASRAASSSRSWCRPACRPSRSSRSRCA